MHDTSKCFIKKNGKYKEITYKELKKLRETDPIYRERCFLLLHGMLLEVTEKDFKEPFRPVLIHPILSYIYPYMIPSVLHISTVCR